MQMEKGLLRNVANHQLSVPWRWRKGNYKLPKKLRNKKQRKYYDPHCTNGHVSGGCEPVAILSADKLFDATTGPLETARIANVLKRDARTGQYVINSETWNCIWEEMIVNRKGLPVTADRPNYGLYDYNFSSEILLSMIKQLNRLISKYSCAQYSPKPTANRIVELLTEHRAALYVELAELASGARVLTERDFLGPETRQRMEQGLPLLDEGRTYTPEQLDALVDQDSEETDDTIPEDLEAIDQDSEPSSWQPDDTAPEDLEAIDQDLKLSSGYPADTTHDGLGAIGQVLELSGEQLENTTPDDAIIDQEPELRVERNLRRAA